MSKFAADLNIGHAGEFLAMNRLKKKGCDVYYNPETSLKGMRAGDLVSDGKNLEIKTDLLAFDTGNVCVEHISTETHTAEQIVYVIPQFFITTREKLKEVIHNPPADTRQVNGGDDFRKQTLIKINSDTFNEVFRRV